MSVGYDKPLYILPFDHRRSYGSEVFGFKEPMTPDQIAQIAASKQVIYDGFKKAIESGVPKEKAGILVDEEFGAAILRDASKRGFTSAMSVEKSGQHEFDFEYGDQYGAHLQEFKPTFAKVLVRYNPDGKSDLNEPDVWKIEGLDRQEDCVKIAEVARRDGRTKVGVIVLGRGEDEQKVVQWLQTAAPVAAFTGFAVGRSTFLEPILQLRNGKLSAMAASSEIARRYQKWVEVFETARAGKK
jgi:myo-inositol catabolism protein IolC